MKKMKTVFVIDRENGHVATNEVMKESAWVLDGEGMATIKFDGTSCMIRDGVLFKRFDAKHGKVPPANWEPCEEAPDANTGHWPGWVPVTDTPENRHHLEGFSNLLDVKDGTFELMGPKINGNKNNLTCHELIKHGSVTVDVTRTFEGIRDWLSANMVEGLVFHHPDGRMAKIRRKDFKFNW